MMVLQEEIDQTALIEHHRRQILRHLSHMLRDCNTSDNHDTISMLDAASRAINRSVLVKPTSDLSAPNLHHQEQTDGPALSPQLRIIATHENYIYSLSGCNEAGNRANEDLSKSNDSDPPENTIDHHGRLVRDDGWTNFGRPGVFNSCPMDAITAAGLMKYTDQMDWADRNLIGRKARTLYRKSNENSVTGGEPSTVDR